LVAALKPVPGNPLDELVALMRPDYVAEIWHADLTPESRGVVEGFMASMKIKPL
jgi:hypothetical protein